MMVRLCVALIFAVAASAARAEGAMCVEDATIADLQEALAAGRVTSVGLTQAYLARIDAYDSAGPAINSVREVNPDALAIAAKLDAKKEAKRRPLEGVPILIKDNIAT